MSRPKRQAALEAQRQIANQSAVLLDKGPQYKVLHDEHDHPKAEATAAKPKPVPAVPPTMSIGGAKSKPAKTEMLQNQKAAVNEQMVEQAAAINVSPLPANQQKPAEVSEPAKRPREAVEPQDAAPPPVTPPVIQIRCKRISDRSLVLVAGPRTKKPRPASWTPHARNDLLCAMAVLCAGCPEPRAMASRSRPSRLMPGLILGATAVIKPQLGER